MGGSTPPGWRSLACGRGAVTTRDMARVGAAVGAISGVLIVGSGAMVMRIWGIGGA